MKLLSNISSITDIYDAFLLDLWGVIHDGSHLYPNVYDTLVKLRKADKKIIFLSNAPRRASRVAAVLEQLGIESALYDHIVSSGEVGHHWLKAGNAPWGGRYYFIGAQKDEDLLYDLDVGDHAFKRVDNLENADFILNLGFGTEEQTAADFTTLLNSAKNLNLPMLCLNPDLEVVKITGQRFPCAGLIAENYQEIGGTVTSFGKPYAQVYEYCHSLLGRIDKNKILAVGDSLTTDILGAKKFGIASMLVTDGILNDKEIPKIKELCLESGLRPNYLITKFGQ